MPGPGGTRSWLQSDVAIRSDGDVLRSFVIVAGLSWSLLFVAIGLQYELQLYGDGSIFSYSIAVRDAWAFHWHNISGRLFVYLFSFLPAEAYVGLTQDFKGGIVVYGILHFSAPFVGLIATLATDRSSNRTIFTYACGSTACVCPLVFGFPTEMWMAHALFWPALAACHHAGRGVGGTAAVFSLLLALILTHGGALIFAATIVLTLALRGWQDSLFRRAAGSFLAALAIWGIVVVAIPPDDYFSRIVTAAAINFINLKNLLCSEFLLLLGALAVYAILFVPFRRFNPVNAHVHATMAAAALLTIYWLRLDQSLHTADRYVVRTALLIATPTLGAMAILTVLSTQARLRLPVPHLWRLKTAFASAELTKPIIGALTLVMLVHAVETVKFAEAWTEYKTALRTLAMGAWSDPALGDSTFVSSARIQFDLNRLSWYSTTPYLSVLVAPGFKPARLVVDPHAGYFWLSCQTAKSNHEADRALPAESRRLLRVYSCLHR